MAKLGRPRILPPRKPRGESSKTTIALQDKQIAMLVNRITELTNDRDSERRARETGEKHNMSMQEIFDKMSHAYTRLQGWQDCAREMMIQPKG